MRPYLDVVGTLGFSGSIPKTLRTSGRSNVDRTMSPMVLLNTSRLIFCSSATLRGQLFFLLIRRRVRRPRVVSDRRRGGNTPEAAGCKLSTRHYVAPCAAVHRQPRPNVTAGSRTRHIDDEPPPRIDACSGALSPKSTSWPPSMLTRRSCWGGRPEVFDEAESAACTARRAVEARRPCLS